MRNRLADETSPYLLQHADNPVEWQPWDEAALAAAKKSGKPILLSIGYSSCHWCHVMAHESFEDPATAAVMNAHFVNIKVDREERPDLDKVYQTAHQLLARGAGGWPLTMFLDPQTLAPFFGGTYFPKTPRFRLPGFVDLLLRIRELFANRRADLDEQGRKLVEAMARLGAEENGSDRLDDIELIDQARQQLGDQYDSQEGGFGSAPKFPRPAALERMLRHQAYRRRAGRLDRDALDMFMTTVTKMARGGIYDHLGGGFCRYATDRQWMTPHFEKMLYDNGQLLSLYADALLVAPDALFEGAVRETVAWLLREMRCPQGGFYAALDADSEGAEGRFYLWRRERVKKLLTADEYLVAETLYGLDKPPNFEGAWHLHRRDAWRSVAERLSLPQARADALLGQRQTQAPSQSAPPGYRARFGRQGADILERSWRSRAWSRPPSRWTSPPGCGRRARPPISSAMRCGARACCSPPGRTAPRNTGAISTTTRTCSMRCLRCSVPHWRDADARFALDLADALTCRLSRRGAGRLLFHRPRVANDSTIAPSRPWTMPSRRATAWLPEPWLA